MSKVIKFWSFSAYFWCKFKVKSQILNFVTWLSESEQFAHTFITPKIFILNLVYFYLQIKGVGGVKISSRSISFIFIYVIDLPFLVSKSAHLSPNSRRFRFYGHLKVGRRSKKWTKNPGQNTVFLSDFQAIFFSDGRPSNVYKT